MKKYKTILADPPWEMGKIGKGRDARKGRIYKVGEIVPIPYPSMPIKDICNLKVAQYADDNCHLWLWATNRTLHDAFHVMDAWGFKYLNVITFYKASGMGPWFVNKTQHLLFGYKGKLTMGEGRYAPTIFQYRPEKHSRKPENSYDLISSISFNPKLELFARPPVHNGWDVWGNEVESSIDLYA